MPEKYIWGFKMAKYRKFTWDNYEFTFAPPDNFRKFWLFRWFPFLSGSFISFHSIIKK